MAPLPPLTALSTFPTLRCQFVLNDCARMNLHHLIAMTCLDVASLQYWTGALKLHTIAAAV